MFCGEMDGRARTIHYNSSVGQLRLEQSQIQTYNMDPYKPQYQVYSVEEETTKTPKLSSAHTRSVSTHQQAASTALAKCLQYRGRQLRWYSVACPRWG